VSDFRRAQSQAHPTKTNLVLAGVIALLVMIVSLQIWLLVAGLNTALGGDRSIVWPAFYASLALFLAGAGLLRFLPQPLRAVARPAERAEPFPDAALAWRTLAVSVAALALSFSVWFLWSAVTVRLRDAGFAITKQQAFWLTATPTVLGSLLRIPYGLLVSRFGSRRSYAAVTLALLVPCVGAGRALADPTTSFGWLLFWAAVTGIAGANFATSMGVVNLWFPKQRQGAALGVNGLGNLGVTIAQLTVPAVVGAALFGALAGSGQTTTLAGGATKTVYLQNAAYVWIPFVLLCAAAIWFWTKDYPMPPKTLASQLRVARDAHTWAISLLYFLTFGCFVAMGSSLPLVIREVFAKAPGGAPNPLAYAPFAPLVATLARPLGGWAADRWGAGRMTAIAVAVMAVGGFSLSAYLAPDAFAGFFATILVICAASGFGNGSVFKIIPVVNPREAGAVIGFVSCLGAFGGFFPPIFLGWCLDRFGTPVAAYTAMALFALGVFAVNGWLYWRRESPSHC
jgi:NNP family nitrate/nitrite transporter-like MFS transporter